MIWTNSSNNCWSTEASSLTGNPQHRKCPKCKKPVGKLRGDFKSIEEKKDSEGETTHWIAIHHCSAILIVWND